MAKRFIVETFPRQFFAFAEPTPLLPWNDPRQPPKDEPIHDVVVLPFFGPNAERHALALELSRLIDDVNRETGAPPTHVNIGRFTFLELTATLRIFQEQKNGTIPAYSKGEGIIIFRGVPFILTPGEDHHAEAVPMTSWLLSRTNPKRFVLVRP